MAFSGNMGNHRLNRPAGWLSGQPARTQRNPNVELGNHRIVVFSGHGALMTVTDANELTFRIPAGVSITFWVDHGVGLPDAMGQQIDPRRGLQDLQARLGGTVQTLRGGEECYNYRLFHPGTLKLNNDPARDPRFIVNPVPFNYVSDAIPLKDLLNQPICRNASVHWACCRSILAW